jgi:hypothetical protein
MRIVANFEGALLRQCHYGPISTDKGVTTWFNDKFGDWDEILLGGEMIILSGPQQWERRKIIKVSELPFEKKGKPAHARLFEVKYLRQSRRLEDWSRSKRTCLVR